MVLRIKDCLMNLKADRHLESWNILVQVEKTGDCDLDLVVGQVGEGGLQKICNKTLKSSSRYV